LPSTSSGGANSGGISNQRRQLRRWLLSPPPHHVADARANVLRALSSGGVPPSFSSQENGSRVEEGFADLSPRLGMMSLPPLKTQVPLGKVSKEEDNICVYSYFVLLFCFCCFPSSFVLYKQTRIWFLLEKCV
jgi:hypothetical protein